MDRIRALELENQRLKILEDENRKAGRQSRRTSCAFRRGGAVFLQRRWTQKGVERNEILYRDLINTGKGTVASATTSSTGYHQHYYCAIDAVLYITTTVLLLLPLRFYYFFPFVPLAPLVATGARAKWLFFCKMVLFCSVRF